MVSTIKSKQDKEDLAVLFVDESHLSHEPYVQRGWQRAKAKHKVHQPKRRESKTIFGALDLASQRMYWKQAARGHATTFIAFLHQYRVPAPTASEFSGSVVGGDLG